MKDKLWALLVIAAMGAGSTVGFVVGRVSSLTAPGSNQAAELDVTVSCQAAPCDVTFRVNGAPKWTVIVDCPTTSCTSTPIATAHRWTGPTCASFLLETVSQGTDRENVTVCDRQVLAVTLSAYGPPPMGISIGVSSDGTNWILVIVSSPRQLATSEAKLAIFSSSGTLVFPPKAFSLLNYSTDRAAFFSTGNGTSVVVGDRLLISTASFPVGDQVQITGLTRILFTGTLR